MKKLVLTLATALTLFGNFCFAQTANDELIKASLAGDLATVKKLVEAGADVNYRNAGGSTPVDVAYFSNEVTEYLLGKGADPNKGDSPSLVSAARYYSADVIKMLLNAKADPNKPAVQKVDMRGPTQKLLDDEKAKGKKGNKYMVKAYEDMLKKLPEGNTITTYALQAAIENTNCLDCIDMLLNAGAKTDISNPAIGGNLIHDVAFSYISAEARAANIQVMGPALEKYGMGIPDWYKNLDPASLGSVDDIIRVLKNKGVDIEGLDNNKRTPLKIAVTAPAPNEELINALINNGAKIKSTGMTITDTEFSTQTSNPEKIKVKFDFPGEGRNSNNGGGYSANMDLVNPKPKRVALISYYLYDAGNGKATGSTFVGKASVTVWRTSDEAGQTQVNGFYNKSIDALVASFKENGIDLLTPNQFHFPW